MKRVVALVVSLIFLLTVTAFAHPFKDVSGHWAESEIERGFSRNIINGDPDGRFRPEDTVTRAEFAKMLAATICERFEVSIPSELESEIHWASKYNNFLKFFVFEYDNLGIVEGIKPGVMETNEEYEKEISRFEMAFMISEVMVNLLGEERPALPETAFVDIEKINSYNEIISGSIFQCDYIGIMKGNEQNMFLPSDKGTRAEAITVINRIDAVLEYAIKMADETKKEAEEEYNKGIESSLVTYTDIPTGHPKVTMTMSNNEKFVIELYPEHAPQTVANFVKLVKDGFYDGLTFHRVVEGFVAQGGSPNGNGIGGSGKNIYGEFSANGFGRNTLKHTKGTVSMARSAHFDSASSQFFICYDDADFLDGSYAAFGKVISGMECIENFTKVELELGSDGAISSPVKPLTIKKATVSLN